MMRLLYPCFPFQLRQPDDIYAQEYAAAIAAGFPVSLFSFEEFMTGSFRARPELQSGEQLCYRGWMLTPADYGRLIDTIRQTGAQPLTTQSEYELCHHLPRWYPALRDETPETLFFPETSRIAETLHDLHWTGCFLKDYVKSLSTHGGSLVTDLDRIPEVIGQMKQYRGTIEGGLCARRIEEFDPGTERRHFVFRGKSFSCEGTTPEVVTLAAERIESPFFTVDTIRRRDGVTRIVELGDGQVSDRKEWPADQFLKILKASWVRIGTNPPSSAQLA